MPQPMQVILVEHDRPAPADQEEVRRRIERCLTLRNARWMRSYYTADGRRSICQFEAPDAETVREAFRAAGHPFDRAWVAQMWWREE
ncbi:MAG TPA: DUF4242 domain-containing protein [Anaeromyxobacter sp.]|nr:DUF4242 domain-containing protein [Anaeromyxobacter sp.]